MTFLQKNSYVFGFFLLILILSFYYVFSHTSNQVSTVHLKIEQGDTLWTLADEFSGNVPHHEWIDEIMKENKMTAPVITAGQTLMIPEDQFQYVNDLNTNLASDAQ